MTTWTTALRRTRDSVLSLRKVTEADEREEVDVAFVLESTYPYLVGGLSAVIHQICQALPHLKIGIIHLTWDRHSPHVDRYGIPSNVRWVHPIYQSMKEHHRDFAGLRPSSLASSRAERQRIVERAFRALDEHLAGNDDALWDLYDEGINPLTRRYRLWAVLGEQLFAQKADTRLFAETELPYASRFWLLREYFSLLYSWTDTVYPKAKVYHAHTTAGAAVAAAAAARQHGTAYLLTEHNLYVRDTVNHGLGRSMAARVTLEQWRDLGEYVQDTFPPTTATMDAKKRAWMAWWSRLGVISYRAADHITYLYPEAIGEAEALGGLPEKSSVLANGVDPELFAQARNSYETRTAGARGGEPFRFVCAARVVPVKGLLDLISACSRLLDAGFTNWVLDICGPQGEIPHYVEACLQRIEELGLTDRVVLRGSVRLTEVLGDYDALVLPSHNEGQPIVVLEAMAVGLPVVGTRVGGMAELVERTLDVVDDQGVARSVAPCGRLVEAHDVAGLADLMFEIAHDEQARSAFSAGSLERANIVFHLDRAMQKYDAYYADLFRGTAPDSSGRDLVAASEG